VLVPPTPERALSVHQRRRAVPCAVPEPCKTANATGSVKRGGELQHPDGLKGEEIPEIARILAVAEVNDTLTAEDTYCDRMTSFQAMTEPSHPSL